MSEIRLTSVWLLQLWHKDWAQEGAALVQKCMFQPLSSKNKVHACNR